MTIYRGFGVNPVNLTKPSRVFGLDRKTVRKMLSFSVPPGYRRGKPPRRPKLGPFTGIIDRILEDDRTSHRKQRHTAKRIFDRLRDEYGFTGGYTIVKDYVREQGLRSREVFVPLSHSPGHAQADFGEAMAVIGGALRKIHFLAFDLPHSDGCFVAAYPAETTEAFCDGHNAAFAFFGGVPRSILYDNTKLAVARILGDGKRQRTRVFTELQSHYLFEDRFGRPGKGNDNSMGEDQVTLKRTGFGTKVEGALEKRAEHLIGEGLAERVGGEIKYRKNLLSILRYKELRRMGAKLTEESGIPYKEARDGERLSGTYRRAVNLMSGKFAFIEKSHEFTLVPWRDVLERNRGKHVEGVIKGQSISWNLGRKRGPEIG